MTLAKSLPFAGPQRSVLSEEQLKSEPLRPQAQRPASVLACPLPAELVAEGPTGVHGPPSRHPLTPWFLYALLPVPRRAGSAAEKPGRPKRGGGAVSEGGRGGGGGGGVRRLRGIISAL